MFLSQILTHCSILDKKSSNAMNAHENFIRIAYYLDEIDKNLDGLGPICIIYNFHKILDLAEKCHQVTLLVRKVDNKHKNENISTGKLLLVMSGVSRNQKLSTKYDFYSFKVSLEVLTE